MPVQAWDDPRTHLLDDTWLLTIFAVLLATALPWFVSDFDIDFVGASWGALTLGAIHVVLGADAGPRRMSAGWRKRVLATLHAAGVIVIGVIWLHAGGVLNPLFLLAFTFPVIGASFISRWQPYLTAVLAIVVVVALALSQAPELRSYAGGLGPAFARLASILGVESVAGSTPFPGFYAPSSYFAVLLQVFAVLLICCAVAAEYLGAVFGRLHNHVMAARGAAERGQELWATLIKHLPLPAFLVDASTLQVICASEHLAPGALTAGEASAGQALFETIHFSYPDVVQELIQGEAGGVARPAMVRVTNELRAAEVRVQHIPYQGRRFALLIISDITESLAVKAALDTADHAALVVDTRGRVMGFNKPALGLFPGTKLGNDVSGLLSPAGATPRWWQSGLTGRRKTHVEIRRRVYQLTSSSVRIPGEEESLHVIAFLPVAGREEIASAAALPKPIEVEPP